jgi:hypothetical protein
MTCGNIFKEQEEPKYFCSIRLSTEGEVYYRNRSDVSIDTTGLHVGGIFITHDAFDKLVEYKRNWENISTTYQGSPTDNRFFRQAERTLLQMKNNLI